MIIKRTAQVQGGQDGAFFGDFMFRFDSLGSCRVYNAKELLNKREDVTELLPIAEFKFNANDALIPHCNAVCFGNERFCENDEFPLLYANVYNNYANAEDRLEGTLCVYRLERDNLSFTTTLVQVIRVGFTDDTVWKSEGDRVDERPYGNFVVDTDDNKLYAFTMRDKEHTARYFAFELPRLSDGEYSEKLGVNLVLLNKSDIQYYFDTEYHLFIQGACCYKGLIYSTEGFNASYAPSIRVIDPQKREQILSQNLLELGIATEAEWIDFYQGVCYYSDLNGNVFTVDFEF